MSEKTGVNSGHLTSFSEYCFQNPEFAMAYARRRLDSSLEIPSTYKSQLQSFDLLRENGKVHPVNERITVGGEGYVVTTSVVAIIGRTSQVDFLNNYYKNHGWKNYLETIGYSVLYERGIIGDEEASVKIDVGNQEEATVAVTYINGILVEYREVDPHYNQIKTPESDR